MASDVSLREKLAQLMLVRIGSNLPPVRTADQDAAAHRQNCFETEAIGGLSAVFNGRWDSTPACPY